MAKNLADLADSGCSGGSVRRCFLVVCLKRGHWVNGAVSFSVWGDGGEGLWIPGVAMGGEGHRSRH